MSEITAPTAYAENDAVPCNCCGMPLGKSSPASHRRLCSDCDPTMRIIIISSTRHSVETCAQDRDAVMGIHADMMSGHNPGRITLPSGRVVECEMPT